MPYEFQDFYIDEANLHSLRLYIDRGVPPGSFLAAVLENNLKEAVSRADDRNMHNLPAYVGYLYNEAPMQCWGSPAKVGAWIQSFHTQPQGEPA